MDANHFKVAPMTVRDQAVENIKEAILLGFLQPGQRLVERDLCELCGVSRTSVREALRVLEGEKLVVNLPHKGPRVAIPTVEDARQIYEVRMLLEGLLGRYAASNASESDLAALRDATDQFEKATETDNLRGMVATADTFYALLAQAANREIVRDLLRTLRARISTLRATSMSDHGRGRHSAAEMRAIITAIQNRDPDAAEACCVHHVRQAASAAEVKLVERVSVTTSPVRRPPAVRHARKT